MNEEMQYDGGLLSHNRFYILDQIYYNTLNSFSCAANDCYVVR